MVGGMMRSIKPRGDYESPFLVSAAAAFFVAMLPPPALALSGPLCAPPTLFGAAERATRAFLFAVDYAVLVYASAPVRNSLADTLVCIARATAASAWICGCHIYIVPVSILQICVTLYFCLSTHTAMQYEGLKLDDRRGSPAPSMVDDDIVVAAAALTSLRPKPVANGCSAKETGFSLSLPAAFTSVPLPVADAAEAV